MIKKFGGYWDSGSSMSEALSIGKSWNLIGLLDAVDLNISSKPDQAKNSTFTKSKLFYFPRDLEEQIAQIQMISSALPQAWSKIPEKTRKDIVDQTVGFLSERVVHDDFFEFETKTELSLTWASFIGRKDLVKTYRELTFDVLALVLDLAGKDSQPQASVSLKNGQTLKMSLDESIIFSEKNGDDIDISVPSRRRTQRRVKVNN